MKTFIEKHKNFVRDCWHIPFNNFLCIFGMANMALIFGLGICMFLVAYLPAVFVQGVIFVGLINAVIVTVMAVSPFILIHLILFGLYVIRG